MAEAAKLMAGLTFSESEHRLALTHSLANEEHAKATTEEATVERKKAKAIEDQATKVVEEYRSSIAFREHVTDMSMDAFILSSKECKKSVAEVFSELDLCSVVVPDGEEEGEAIEEVEEGELPVATEATPMIGVGEEADGDEVTEVPPLATAPMATNTQPPTLSAEVSEAITSPAEVPAPKIAPELMPEVVEVPPPSVVSGATPE